jgi:hypothetical protein
MLARSLRSRACRPIRVPHVVQNARAMSSGGMETWEKFSDLDAKGVISPDVGMFRKMALFNLFSNHLDEKMDVEEFVEGTVIRFSSARLLMRSNSSARSPASLQALRWRTPR